MDHKNAVLTGLEKMVEHDQINTGLVYPVNGHTYTVGQMIEEIKNDTEDGIAFCQNVYDLVLAYMGKFSQKAD